LAEALVDLTLADVRSIEDEDLMAIRAAYRLGAIDQQDRRGR